MNVYGETETRHVKAGKGKQHRKGCPENNNKEHIYVWSRVGSHENKVYERLTCCGCGHTRKRAKNQFRIREV